MNADEDRRGILIEAVDLKKSPAAHACAAISWRRILGLVGSEVKICHFYMETRHSTLTYNDTYTLEWAPIDESSGS